MSNKNLITIFFVLLVGIVIYFISQSDTKPKKNTTDDLSIHPK
jgi:hypothetical protein